MNLTSFIASVQNPHAKLYIKTEFNIIKLDWSAETCADEFDR